MATITSPAVKRRVKKNKRALPMTITLIAVGLVGWWGWAKTHPAVDPLANVITAQVTKGDLTETVSATGSVTAQTGAEVKIGSQITGTIKRLFADVGTEVKAHDMIAELDLPDVKAQADQAKANLAAAQTKLAQDISGVGMQHTQVTSAVNQARAALRSAQAHLVSTEATARLQTSQTPTDVRRAQAALDVAKAALSTARANLVQVQADASLEIATAQENLTQAKANAVNNANMLQRQQALVNKGFVAASVVDAARAADQVSASQVAAAQQNIGLVQQKVTADTETARDQVTQAEQNVESAKAALASAKAETYSDQSKLADVQDARAAVHQAEANLQLAMGNTAQDVLKQQDIEQAQDAVRAAQQQVIYNQAQVDKTLIRSPISGTVLQLAAQQGETLAAGLSAPTLIVVADLNRLQVDAYVDETDIGKVRLGQQATMSVDAFPKRKFEGQVVKIASGSTIQQGVVTYDVTINLKHTESHQLKPDMTASVTIETGTRHDVLLVPTEAVKLGTHGSTVNVVTTVDGVKTVTPVRIRTGSSDGTNTEVRTGPFGKGEHGSGARAGGDGGQGDRGAGGSGGKGGGNAGKGGGKDDVVLKEGDTVVLAGMDQGHGGMGPSSPFGPSGGKAGGGGKR